MFDPEDFRRLAAEMLQGRCSPAQTRTAISRSYYAPFLIAKRDLGPHFFFEKGAKAHEQVQQLFLSCGGPPLKAIGRKLDELRAVRNDADYDLADSYVDSRDNARLEEQKSARLIRELKLVFDPTNISVHLQEMRKWAKDSGAMRIRQQP
jgi:hypothetical protein